MQECHFGFGQYFFFVPFQTGSGYAALVNLLNSRILQISSVYAALLKDIIPSNNNTILFITKRIQKKNIKSAGRQVLNIQFFNAIRFAINLYAPGTPAGNCLKKTSDA
jgi:hypothetical protein